MSTNVNKNVQLHAFYGIILFKIYDRYSMYISMNSSLVLSSINVHGTLTMDKEQ
jgi:hypothetical protein